MLHIIELFTNTEKAQVVEIPPRWWQKLVYLAVKLFCSALLVKDRYCEIMRRFCNLDLWWRNNAPEIFV